MRTNKTKALWWVAALGGAALFGTVQGWAQTQTFVVDTFDSDDSSAWTRWWGSATQDYSWDGTVDANNNPNSGSLEGVIGFSLSAYGGDNQFALQHYFGQTLDGTQFTNLVFDIKYDTNSPTRPTLGDFGYLDYGLIASDYSQIFLDNPAVTVTNGNWLHVVAPLDPTTPKLNAVIGVVFKCWAGDTGPNAVNTLTGTTTFWLDNVELIGMTNTAPPPPPTLAIQPASPGLQLFASQPGAQYQRQGLRLQQNTGYSWVGSASPVTYSITIANYPASAYSGFQTQIFLVPGSGIPNYEDAPDYNEPNLFFLNIQNQASGAATGSVQYKTNEPNGNAMVYNTNPTNGPVGNLGAVSAPSAIGTWTLTFSQDTNVTVTAPGGATGTYSIPAAAAALFADPLYVYIGDQPNQTTSIGQSALLSDFRIYSGTSPATNILFADNFATDGGLDTTNTWQIIAGDAAGVQLVPPTTAYWLTWTTPANGYNLEATSTLSPQSWVDAVSTYNLNPPVQIFKSVAVQAPYATPATNIGFFRVTSQ